MNSKLLKKSILIITSLAILGGGIFFSTYFSKGNFEESVSTSKIWQEYSPNNQKFYVQFPAKPQENSKELNIANKTIRYKELSIGEKDSEYAVSYIDFPGHWKIIGTNKLLTKSFDAFIENEKNVEAIVNQELTMHKGYPSLNYHLKQAGKEIKGKFIIVGNTLYRVTVTYPLALAEKIKPEVFFDSFNVNH